MWRSWRTPGTSSARGNLLLRAIDYGQLGHGRLIRRTEARQEIRNVYAAAIAREREVLWETSGTKPLLLRAGWQIDHRDVVAEGVGDVQGGSGAVCYEADGTPPHADGASDCQCLRVDFSYGVARFIGDVERVSVRRDGDSLRALADLCATDDALRARVHHEYCVAVLADNVQALTIRRELQGDGA